MDLHSMSWRMFFIRIVEIVFVINIAILDIFAIQGLSRLVAPLSTMQTKQNVVQTITPTPLDSKASNGATLDVPQGLSNSGTTPTPVAQTIINSTAQTNTAKEIFIPLGTGQSSASDWTTVTGVQASIDSANYPNIKQVVFESAISVPTANEIVWVRLFDTTDGHPVWFSEMNMNSASQFLTSSPITLDNGNKTYVVQMKTQLQYPANLTEARIHITLQ